MDSLVTGRRIKLLICVDDFKKKCLAVIIAFRISGVQVMHFLDSISQFKLTTTTSGLRCDAFSQPPHVIKWHV
ncbi:hypothetical protein DOU50_11890 [Enterobacter sp. C6]|nr:hypothetical protein DOU50_11890 [Enterobacter sp. C6]